MSITTILSVSVAFMLMIMFWYNGVLEVRTDDDGDNLKLNINEYDMIRRKRFMIVLIKKK
ncbi:hypothetical protein [Romboutsia sp.]|uniref:hypothetical protein n=1 Tax=Romboutsia sp. TaxID=1965302 RepID=UPI002BBD17D0|nr:hypothetical protein [Romboutsia sp.]HSQ90456.1 hypothetical protein [Romboutsia sp.]